AYNTEKTQQHPTHAHHHEAPHTDEEEQTQKEQPEQNYEARHQKQEKLHTYGVNHNDLHIIKKTQRSHPH
ncbi:hypothetical protein RA264_29250, partial [Pseudomonas syringae pv. tagetis]|uniref:hypothetical protein n=1 Tax=Pseudomonas syringae group genomosp. 7 TaxID=251699 RepID=UPI0037705BE5